jgi:HAMP domain-containing protein
METLLSPGIISLLLITGVLAIWIALRVGKPLRRLQEEVSQVSAAPAHLNHVTVTEFNEVADVSRAINRLVDKLRTHIDGMNQLVLNVSH